MGRNMHRVRTELYFRQVLGRVLRRTSDIDEQAWLFMLAEPTLKGFAERIAEDLPEDLAVLSQLDLTAVSSESYLSETDAGGLAMIGQGDQELDSPSCGHDGEIVPALDSPRYQVRFSPHYRELLLACF